MIRNLIHSFTTPRPRRNRLSRSYRTSAVVVQTLEDRALLTAITPITPAAPPADLAPAATIAPTATVAPATAQAVQESTYSDQNFSDQSYLDSTGSDEVHEYPPTDDGLSYESPADDDSAQEDPTQITDADLDEAFANDSRVIVVNRVSRVQSLFSSQFEAVDSDAINAVIDAVDTSDDFEIIDPALPRSRFELSLIHI